MLPVTELDLEVESDHVW